MICVSMPRLSIARSIYSYMQPPVRAAHTFYVSQTRRNASRTHVRARIYVYICVATRFLTRGFLW